VLQHKDGTYEFTVRSADGNVTTNELERTKVFQIMLGRAAQGQVTMNAGLTQALRDAVIEANPTRAGPAQKAVREAFLTSIRQKLSDNELITPQEMTRLLAEYP